MCIYANRGERTVRKRDCQKLPDVMEDLAGEPLSLESLTGSPEELADAIEEATALLLDSRAIKQQSMELRWHELLLSSHSYANKRN